MVLFLNRNLRKNILQGHPWIYREALQSPQASSQADQATLAVLKDSKKQFVAWGYYDPQGPLAFRVLSLKDKKPSLDDFQKTIIKAGEKRKYLLSTHTNAFRLINGEGDHLPGLVCDVYNDIAVLQFDGLGPSQFWSQPDRLNAICLGLQHIFESFFEQKLNSIVIKERGASEALTLVKGEPVPLYVEIQENLVKFHVRILEGQKTGFFLDQRDNRNYVKSISKGKSVLNLYSYTGGFSIYAGMGGAKKVVSVDISKGAIDQAESNWQLNGLQIDGHQGMAFDVSEFLEKSNELLNISTWDMILVDPPSMTHSEKQKPQAVAKYIDVFSQAAKKVKDGGDLILSSCSSHISFEDFYGIINEALSKARKRGQILRVSGQGSDHPFLHISHELRYLKFVHLCIQN